MSYYPTKNTEVSSKVNENQSRPLRELWKESFLSMLIKALDIEAAIN
jgi:hypothetical protein